MIKIRIALALTLSLLLTACASTPINPEALRSNKIDTIAYNAPSTLNHTLSSNTAPTVVGGHGSFSKGFAEGFLASLIISGIDAGINSKRKKAFTPIRETLTDYDAKAVFVQKLSTLKGEIFSDKLMVQENQNTKEAKRKLHELHVNSYFALAPNHRSLSTTVTADLSVNEKNDLNGSAWIGTSELDMGGTKVSKADVTQFWVDNPEELQKHIEESMDLALQQMVRYFSEVK